MDELPFERQFADAFASLHRVPYCVPTVNGSSALVIALEALGIGPGQEVLVPGLTWVACGSAVARVGATPVLVDIDPKTLCMSAEAAQQAITCATAAIMLVHLYCTIADLEAFTELAVATGLPLIEDCSHSHGAFWRGRRIGTFGTLGVFSMQQSKVLTSGEGGAVITSHGNLYDSLQQYRADGRRYVKNRVPGEPELDHAGTVQGHNYCLSEFHSAVLLDRLHSLDHENAIRLTNAIHLTRSLQKVDGVRPLHDIEAESRPTFYRYCIRLDLAAFGEIPIETLAIALTAELGIPVQPIYDPLNRNLLFDPRRSPRRPQSPYLEKFYNPARFKLPEAEAARRDCLTIPHNILLGGNQEVDDVVRAIEKLQDHHAELPNIA